MTVVAVVGDSISAGSPLWDPDPAVRAPIPSADERSQWQWWAALAEPLLKSLEQSGARIIGLVDPLPQGIDVSWYF